MISTQEVEERLTRGDRYEILGFSHKLYPLIGGHLMSILSTSPLSPTFEEADFGKGSPTFSTLLAPLEAQLSYLTPLESGSNRPLEYTFEYQVRGLVYYRIII